MLKCKFLIYFYTLYTCEIEWKSYSVTFKYKLTSNMPCIMVNQRVFIEICSQVFLNFTREVIVEKLLK